ncbi:LysR family transcriptional regulator [Brevibacterium aurantiacum]|uniref:LysR family transcriptional regulator n=1 Tax=Brevibacterium aurantiacum TaxID=273384 RepID=A0A556CCG6_BREAU|nr:LysR family transcriptional regulator [Brevibacterium aurantiacum]TSI15100.1 LysR family transcriptional regulator [Brevibacterium aurantiacum]
MALTLIQLQIFLAAANLGSFTAAAKSLHMSQPTVSEAVRRIENSYGSRLFIRGSRRLVLTPTGEELLPLADGALSSALAADQVLKSIRGLEGGVASFGLPRNAKYYSMANLLSSFNRSYPKVRLRVFGINSADVADMVSEGKLEAGVVVLPIESDELELTPMLRDEVLYVSSDPEHALAPISIETLSERSLILYDANAGWRDPTRRQIAERALLAGTSVQPLIEVEQVDSALELVVSGAGDTFVSRSIVESEAFPSHLHSVAFEQPLYDTLAIVKRQDGNLSPATAELARLAREILSRSPLSIGTAQA